MEVNQQNNVLRAWIKIAKGVMGDRGRILNQTGSYWGLPKGQGT